MKSSKDDTTFMGFSPGHYQDTHLPQNNFPDVKDFKPIKELQGFEGNNAFFATGTFSLFTPEDLLTVNTVIDKIDNILLTLDTCTGTVGKGYLNKTDLTKFPIIKEILPFFIKTPRDKIEQAYDFILGDRAKDSYQWIYNLIVLNLYQVCLEQIKNSDPQIAESDLIINLRFREKVLYKRLDPTIRQVLLKRGISIIQNIYTGFDTEYKTREVGFNELLSCQLAITTKTYLKVPKKLLYSTSKIDVAADVIRKHRHTENIFDFNKIESYLQTFIDKIRTCKFGENDKYMSFLIKSLNELDIFKRHVSDDFVTYSLPRSVIQPFIFFGNSYSFKEMVEYSNKIGCTFLDKTYSDLIDLLKNIFTIESYGELDKQDYLQQMKTFFSFDNSKVAENIKDILPIISYSTPQIGEGEGEGEGKIRVKKLSRKNMADMFPKDVSDNPNKVSVSKIKNNYFVAHLTQADLSLMKDFEEFKDNLNIVNGCFVTIGKPFIYAHSNIFIRDTMLLAPGGSKSLASIGKLYGEDFNKIELTKEEIENMDVLLKTNKTKFEEYAIRDALIALIHASWMEDFNFSLGGLGIPLTLSSIGRKFVKNIWDSDSYPGYQISHKFLIGDNSTTITPIGLNMIKNLGVVLPYYISNYKGGRNESFMYGLDKETTWYDYDLISAYTTVLSKAGHPDYGKCVRLKEDVLKNMSKFEILYSYIIIKASFMFKKTVKYPSIPCYVDETTTVYPLNGTCILTGAEYLLAVSQECKLIIDDIFYIPFSKRINQYGQNEVITPFGTVLELIQRKRREFAKGTINNLMYKEIGNSIYGSTVRGMSNKRRFDIKTGNTVRVEGDDLTNPLIASWTTAFIRSIIGECLHSIALEKGLVVSVTTDGFITNLKDLELNLNGKTDTNLLFNEFKLIRLLLSSNDDALEVKSSGKGILSWTTRGQVGIESKMIASTGFQRSIYKDKDELFNIFLDTFKSDTKTLEYIQFRLRSASDIYKKGGHVTPVYRDQLFRMHYDNRRLIIDPNPEKIQDFNDCLLDSKPVRSIEEAANLRFISKINKTGLYSKQTSVGGSTNSYRTYEDLAVRNFIKGLLSNPPKFNLNRNELDSYQKIIDFVRVYNPRLKYTAASISNLKLRPIKWKAVPRTSQNEAFIKYVQTKFNEFDINEFYRGNK